MTEAAHGGATDDAVLTGVLDQLSLRPLAVERLTGGSVNVTHRVRLEDDTFLVIRFPVDRARTDEFPVELWASRRAAAAGIATARGLSTGRCLGVPYMVVEYVEPARAEIAQPWSWLGEYARKLASISVEDAPDGLFSRFGRDLPRAWAAHVAYNLTQLDHDDPLLRDGAYRADWRDPLVHLTTFLGEQDFAFGLAHGDLAPRNLLSRGPTQSPVLIDWGTATTGPTPWADAQQVFRWARCDQTITDGEYDQFAAAAGIATPADRRVVTAMAALELVDVTRWARDRRPDLYASYVQSCRQGLAALLATQG